LAIHRALGLYYAWLVVDILVIVPFMVHGYTAMPKTTGAQVAGALEEKLLGGGNELSDARDDRVGSAIGLPHSP